MGEPARNVLVDEINSQYCYQMCASTSDSNLNLRQETGPASSPVGTQAEATLTSRGLSDLMRGASDESRVQPRWSDALSFENCLTQMVWKTGRQIDTGGQGVARRGSRAYRRSCVAEKAPLGWYPAEHATQSRAYTEPEMPRDVASNNRSFLTSFFDVYSQPGRFAAVGFSFKSESLCDV